MNTDMQTKSKTRSKFGKSLKFGVMATTLAVVLTGCGSGSPKEEYANAYDELKKAKSYEVTSNIGFNIESDLLDAQEVEMLNSVKMNMDVKSNVEKNQHEIDMAMGLSMGAMSLDFDLPIFVDGANQKVYTKAESMLDMVSGLTGMMGFPLAIETPEEVKGKVVEMSTKGEDTMSQEDLDKFMESLTTKSKEFMNSLDEESFKKEGDVISFTVKGDVMTDVVKEMMESNPVMSMASDTMGTPAPIDLAENVSFGDVTVKAMLDGKSLAKEEMTVPMTIDAEGEKTTLTMTVTNEYKNIGKKVKFSFDLSEDNIISEKEFEDILNDAMGFGSVEE